MGNRSKVGSTLVVSSRCPGGRWSWGLLWGHQQGLPPPGLQAGHLLLSACPRAAPTHRERGAAAWLLPQGLRPTPATPSHPRGCGEWPAGAAGAHTLRAGAVQPDPCLAQGDRVGVGGTWHSSCPHSGLLPRQTRRGAGTVVQLRSPCFPPQVLLFLALFGVGLYFMLHISVGLDQELALPKVSQALWPQWGGGGGGSTAHRAWRLGPRLSLLSPSGSAQIVCFFVIQSW